MLETQKNNFNYNKKLTKHNFFYSLDCQSGEGLVNPLLSELKKISNVEFKFYLKFILQKCININRSFSDAVEFLSIWLKKSPDNLLYQLKNAKLKQFFNRTEYDHEGLNWYFPTLLRKFAALVKEPVTADEILHYLFETFDFFSIPEIFVTDVIGYNRLEQCVKESPVIFRQALLSKMYEFVEQNKTIDIGKDSHRYLNEQMHAMHNIKRPEAELAKPTQGQELIAYIKQNQGLFTYPSFNFYNGNNLCIHKPNFRGGSNY